MTNGTLLDGVSMLGDGRYAPSPSGILHVGNLRTALLAWTYARSSQRGFLLRIEDLDGRSRPEFEAAQLRDLSELGIDWDGVPIRQSDRVSIYASITDALSAQNLTFECYCSRKDLAEAASAPHHELGFYPGTCRDLSVQQRAERRSLTGRAPAIRLRSEAVSVAFTDENYGRHSGHSDDIVLRRGDGTYSYNFVAVVDDILGQSTDPSPLIASVSAGNGNAGEGVGDRSGSGNEKRPDARALLTPQVTQIVRGNDLLSSTPRQIYLQKLLGFEPPQYAHVPLVVNHDAVRLSKRDGAVTLPQLHELGISTSQLVGMFAESLGFPAVGSAQEFLEVFQPEHMNKEPWVFTEPNV
ncbi:glutamyl-tRNA synthetase [Arcanobacterium pluranimalium]|uniref:glutamyl-Q tRNA(Asp) synthetase n=1 Tax=Arcanobacterium pluranimalium TaxID=108028 RepID=UPI001EF864CB|nr:glutamyl-Q tRNA(Asp) synthetase [Arcanobacterium pluranimalium]MBM7824258.1 glutamyl-tRNA synthetase [Arcanobacterium pluranimalium]